MSKSISMADARTQILALSGMENSDLPTTAELDQLINEARSEYIDALIDAQHYPNLKSLTATVTSSDSIDDLYHMVHVLRTDGARAPTRLDRLQPHQRTWVDVNTDSIEITYEYIPLEADLATNGTIYGIGDGIKYILAATSARLIHKDERDPSFQQAIADRALARVKDMAPRHMFDGLDFPDDRWHNRANHPYGNRYLYRIKGGDVATEDATIEFFKVKSNIDWWY